MLPAQAQGGDPVRPRVRDGEVATEAEIPDLVGVTRLVIGAGVRPQPEEAAGERLLVAPERG